MKKRHLSLILLSLSFMGGCALPKKSVDPAPIESWVDDIRPDTPFYDDISLDEAQEVLAANDRALALNIGGNCPALPETALKIALADLDGMLLSWDKNSAYVLFSDDEAASVAAASRLAQEGFVSVYRVVGDCRAQK